MNRIKSILINGRSLLVRRQSGIFSAAFVIAFTYGISMLLGIFRERLLVSRFYDCCRAELDVYYAAFRLPDMIFQLVVIGALSAAFIPIFSEKLANDEKEAYKMASSLINLLLGFFLVLAVLLFIFARPFSGLITGNFSEAQVDLMAQMTRAMLLAQVFFLVSNFFSAMVQSHQRFLLPSISPVFYNLGIIISIVFLTPALGIWSATVGVLIGSFLHLLIQVPLIFRLGFKYSFVFDWNNKAVRRVIKLMFPRTLALAASQVEATVSLFLATSLSPGSLTLYYLAQRLVDLPVRLLGTSVGQAALPALSFQSAQNQTEEFTKTLRRVFNQILYFTFPTTSLFLVLRVPLVRIAYGARTFPWDATLITGKTVAVVVFSILSQSEIQLLARGFYAVQDTTFPFIVSCLSVVINIVLSLVFIFHLNLGIFGLALAFSISNLVNFLLLLFYFNFKKDKFLKKEDLSLWVKMFFASIIAAVGTWVSMKFLDNFILQTEWVFPLLILTLASVIVGLLIYALVSLFFGFEEFYAVLRLFQKFDKIKKEFFSTEKIIEPYSDAGTGV